MTDDAFDDIVAGFYRAASGTIGWVDALVPFQRALSAIAIYLHGVDTTQGRVAFAHAASDMPLEAEVDYLRTYHRIDPRVNLVIDRAPGEWTNCWEHFDDDFVAHDRFYQEFLIPYGGRYVSGVKLLQDEATSVFLGVHRGHGHARLDAAEIGVCQRLARHLAEALTLHRARIRAVSQSPLGQELLARLRAPVALIDDERRLLQANPAATALLRDGTAIFESQQRFHCRRSSDDSALLAGLQALLRHDDPPASDVLYVRASGGPGERGLGLHLHALRPQQTMHAFGTRPLAMLLIHDPTAHLALDPFVVAAAFGMTPAEARVATATAEGLSAEDIATRHGVSIHTVRSQMQTILQKTGTMRQAELVSVLAALPTAAFGSNALPVVRP